MLPHPPTPRARRVPGTSTPTGLVPALVLLGFGVTALCGVAVLLLWGRLPITTPPPDGLPEVIATSAAASATPLPAVIQGTVWEDLCDEHRPSTPACVLDTNNRYSANGNRDNGELGLAGLLVALGVGPCPAAPILTPLTGPDGDYTFGGLPAGTYCISIDPAQDQNIDLIPGAWSWPIVGAGSAVQVTVNVATGEVATVNFGWDRHAPVPTAGPTTATPTPPPAGTRIPTLVPGCSDFAAFMADVTIPDQTILPAGAPFVKTWRVLNTGSCTWDPAYSLVFDSGEVMSGTASLPLSSTVAPGGVLDLSVSLVAPTTPGTHTGAWLLRGHNGQLFGTGPDAHLPLIVRIVVSGTLATPTPAPSAWQAAYFNNRDLAGNPVLTRSEAALNYDWAQNAPAPGVNPDDFSVRWTGSPVFEDGLYRLSLVIDDGARLYLDGELIIDEWRDASRREVSVERALLAGQHPVRLDYYDHSYEAVAMLRWERVGAYPYWQGEYWNNTTFSGGPVLVRQDARLDFSWGVGSPAAGLPADNFSARWTRSSNFDASAYRFRVTVDDGARLWVDDQLVIDAWVPGPPRELTGDVGLSAGPHTVRVEYFENGLEARLAVRWEKIAAIAYPDWKAEYWGNPRLEGGPLLVRNEPQPDRNWEEAAPAPGLPADNFSARWTKTLTFGAGQYRFYARADDGVRVMVGNQTLIDEWHLSSATTEYQATLVLNGTYPVVIEYFDSALTARVHVWWERIGDAP